jgi:hypothetical protein
VESTTIKQEGADFQLYGLTGSAMGLVATMMTCFAIAERWGTYGWWNRVLAMTLVLSLVAVPVAVVIKEKTWAKRLETLGKANLALGYSWVLLGTLLFNRL